MKLAVLLATMLVGFPQMAYACDPLTISTSDPVITTALFLRIGEGGQSYKNIDEYTLFYTQHNADCSTRFYVKTYVLYATAGAIVMFLLIVLFDVWLVRKKIIRA